MYSQSHYSESGFWSKEKRLDHTLYIRVARTMLGLSLFGTIDCPARRKQIGIRFSSKGSEAAKRKQGLPNSRRQEWRGQLALAAQLGVNTLRVTLVVTCRRECSGASRATRKSVAARRQAASRALAASRLTHYSNSLSALGARQQFRGQLVVAWRRAHWLGTNAYKNDSQNAEMAPLLGSTPLVDRLERISLGLRQGAFTRSEITANHNVLYVRNCLGYAVSHPPYSHWNTKPSAIRRKLVVVGLRREPGAPDNSGYFHRCLFAFVPLLCSLYLGHK
ncbi:hypothetical protein GW17_00043239 [Ensete ventricosum]|nr:hypothetical protein GW17_00043239 [Ensete ventricosum]